MSRNRAIVPTLLLMGCAEPVVWGVGNADLLFVIDNSSSMVDEVTALAMGFGDFVEGLSSAGTGLQYAVTTTDVDSEAGRMVGSRVAGDAPEAAEGVVNAVLCDATCITNPTLLGDDPSYSCQDGGAPLSEQDELTRQYLDCACGSAGDWLGNCGSAQEEPLEAVFLAMCRAVENPPEACFEGVVMVDDAGVNIEWEPALTEQDRDSNAGLLRDGATFLPVIVTDEGDSSRREPERSAIPAVYEELFSQFNHPLRWVVIGPGVVDMGGMYSTTCNSLGTGSAAFRFEHLVTQSLGLKVDITTPEPDCEVNIEDAMTRLKSFIEHL